MKFLMRTVCWVIAFFLTLWVPLTQASHMTLSVDVSDLTVNLQNLTTGQVINPNDIDTQVGVYGGAFYPLEGTSGPYSTGKGYASVSYTTGTWLKKIEGSVNYNLASNSGGVSINLKADGPNPGNSAYGEAYASIEPHSPGNVEYNIRFNFHIPESGQYALGISGDYVSVFR